MGFGEPGSGGDRLGAAEEKHYRLSSVLVLMVLVPKILFLDLPGFGPWNRTGALLIIAILYAISLLYRKAGAHAIVWSRAPPDEYLRRSRVAAPGRCAVA